MSIKLIKQQINRFLSSQTPEVISIKGAWGVGKTYAWNTYLVEGGCNLVCVNGHSGVHQPPTL